jgi:hypothetical protein
VIEPATTPTPVAVTEPFSETLTPNGARTHPFKVQQAGTVSATITALAPDDTVTVGLSLGTWNGAACSAILANDQARLNTSLVGTAQQTGDFCVRLYDATGTLAAATDYTVEVTHY